MVRIEIPMMSWFTTILGSSRDATTYLDRIRGAVSPSGVIDEVIDASQADDTTQEQDAVVLILRLIADGLDQGWDLEVEEKKLVYLSEPDISDNERRRHHLSRILTNRVREQHQSDSLKPFLSEMHSNMGEFVSDPNRIPRTYGLLRGQFSQLRVIPLDDSTVARQRRYRYLRHYWRIPFNSMPGRSISFVVELDNQDIIGIFQLSSPTLWMSGRDEALGFQSLDRLRRIMETDSEPIRITERKGEWIERIQSSGMRDDGANIHPTSGRFTVGDFHSSMIRALQNRLRDLPLNDMGDIGLVDWEPYGISPVAEIDILDKSEKWVKKRERIFEKAYGALVRLSRLRAPASIGELWHLLHDSADSSEIIRAYKHAMREQKTSVFTGSVADISVCGAIPPYNDLRVGKLIAMLAFSEEVNDIWKSKYSNNASVIASKLAGRKITRKADLVALATTGVYGRGNIQYDRITLGEGVSLRRMRYVGITGESKIRDGSVVRRGPTTMNVSLRTWSGIAEYCKDYKVASNTSGEFGEGTSPRIRRLLEVKRSLCSVIEMPPDLFDSLIMNRFSRSIHVGLLDRNSIRYLLGIDSNFGTVAPLPKKEEIIETWCERWLRPLCEREDWNERLRRISELDLAVIFPSGIFD